MRATHPTGTSVGPDMMCGVTEFEDAIRWTGPDDAGAYEGRLTDEWSIGEAVNGGLLMALASRATGDASSRAGGHADTLTFSAVFLSPGKPGPVLIRPEMLRTGRSMSTAQVRVSQEVDGVDTERFRGLVNLGDLERYTVDPLLSPPPPELPDPQDCVSADDAPSGLTESGLLQRLHMRLDPDCVGWVVGAPSRRGEMRGWLRLADGHEPDAAALLLALDAFPPIVFDLGSQGWAPTIEFTGYVRRRPAPGWLRIRTHADQVAGGLFNEDCDIWDSTGTLVAHSRQLGSARFPDA